MRKLKKDQIEKMDVEATIEELRHVNNLTLHNDKILTYLILLLIAFIVGISAFYSGEEEALLLIKHDMEFVLVVSLFSLVVIGTFISSFYTTYKHFLIDELMKKKRFRGE